MDSGAGGLAGDPRFFPGLLARDTSLGLLTLWQSRLGTNLRAMQQARRRATGSGAGSGHVWTLQSYTSPF